MSFLEKISSIFFQNTFSQEYLEKLPPVSDVGLQKQMIFSIWNYKSKRTKKLIRHMKTYRSYFLSKHIGKYLADEIISYVADQQSLSYFKEPLIIPIPINRQRKRERGFNQTHLYSKFLAKNIHGTYKPTLLQKKVSTKKQALIKNRSDRFRNVIHCFSINNKNKHIISGRDIILVDDLVTTGATLREAKRVLYRAGARNIIAVTVAH